MGQEVKPVPLIDFRRHLVVWRSVSSQKAGGHHTRATEVKSYIPNQQIHIGPQVCEYGNKMLALDGG